MVDSYIMEAINYCTEDKLLNDDTLHVAVVRPLVKSVIKKLIFLFLIKTYVDGTQKNRLNETILLSTQNTC